MVYKSDWSSETEYAVDDIVRYAYDGTRSASWIALQANKNMSPISGAYWGVLAIDGSSITGPQGPIGMVGPQGSTGLSGVIYQGQYDSTQAYTYQSAVAYQGAIYVATDIARAGTVPPSLPWQLYPGYDMATPFGSTAVPITITTAADFVSDKVTGVTTLTTTVQEYTAGDDGTGLAFLSGVYELTCKGTLTVTVPEGWNTTELIVGVTGGATATRLDNETWQVSCATSLAITITFYGISVY